MNDMALSTAGTRREVNQESQGRLTRFAPSSFAASAAPSLLYNFEPPLISRNGGVFIQGWMNDAETPVETIRLIGKDWSLGFEGPALARTRRLDVETMLEASTNYSYGYFGFQYIGEQIDSNGDFKLEICLESGWKTTADCKVRTVRDTELRDITLAHLASAQHFGNYQVGGVACVDGGLGSEIIAHNHSITANIVSGPYVERFLSGGKKKKGSIVVCLYGRVDYLFVQNALFSSGAGIADYEFIYICNSPELAEPLLAETRIASRIYGLDQTVIILPGNAGFGGANNLAARFAQTDRLLIMNPDVFPFDRDWARKHTALLENLPPEQTALFGAALYYDNGSLMHGGMYYEIDKGPTYRGDKLVEFQLARVEHYGKGAPPEAERFLASRPVPGITGAFMSCDRNWFEHLGGFSEDYVFGHYEDADLCLKSIRGGVLPWLHDLKLWHLEGQGSVRLPPHEGGSIINRWLFSANWGPYISDHLLGPVPSLPAFSMPKAAAVSSAPKRRVKQL